MKRKPLMKRGLVLLFFFVCNCRITSAQSSTQDIGWPRQITKDGSTLIYYQPQIDEWKDYKDLSCRFAFSLEVKNGKQLLGVASMKCGTLVDKENHTVYFKDGVYEDVRFPSLSDDSVKMMTS